MYRILFINLIFIMNTSIAGIMIEPYLGYAMNGKGDSSLKSTDGSASVEYEWERSSLTYGARVGFSNLLGIVYGVEYCLQPSHEVTATGKVAGTTNYTFDASSTHLGLFLGLYIPFIKVRASYFLKSTLKTEADSTPAVLKSGDEFEGKGMSIGAGISVFPFITLNVDYRNFTYDALNPYPNSAGPYEVDGKISEILISLSVPL